MSAVIKSSKSREGEELEDVVKTNKLSAWQDASNGGGRKMMSKSLGRNVEVKISQQFTSGGNMSSSESDSDTDDSDDSDDEGDTEEEQKQQRQKSPPKLKTRSLGRSELYNVTSSSKRASSFVPVSERSAAYKELVMSTSQHHPCKTPTNNSIIRLRNHTSASRIEDNPFFRQDRHRTSSPIAIQPPKSISALEGARRASRGRSPSPSVTPSSSISSPSRSAGISSVMSVQMRIKIWKEKEEEAKTQVQDQQRENKLNNRKSLQQVSLLAVQTAKEEENLEVEQDSRGAHSDDEVAKGGSADHGNGRADHSYEIIDNIVGHSVRLTAASSSSSISDDSGDSGLMGSKRNGKQNGRVSSPSSGKTKKEGKKKKSEGGKRKSWNPLNRILKQTKKKSSSIDSTSSKDSVSSPAYKRPHTISKHRLPSDLSKEEEGTSSADDVFSPVHRSNGISRLQNGELGKDGHPLMSEKTKPTHMEVDELSFHSSSVEEQEDKSGDSAKTSSKKKEERSISTDIRSIINALGSSEESSLRELDFPSCNVIMENSTSDEEDEEEEVSSLDVARVGRQTLKRRASDSVKSLSLIKKNHAVRKGSLSPYDDTSESVIATPLIHGDAVWDRVALDGDELSFRVGEEVEVLDMTDDVWWYGSVNDSTGWFPASFVRLRIGQTENDDMSTPPAPPSSSPKSQGASTESAEVPSLPEDDQRHPPPEPTVSRGEESAGQEESDSVAITIQKNFSKPMGNSVHRRMTIRRRDSIVVTPRRLSPREVRGKIIEEILNTERDYVKHLEDIIEGYLKRCREYVGKLFTEEQIDTIFSNVEKVYEFQRDFLMELEARVNKDHLDQSQIGEVFVVNKYEFRVYSHYCNNHPNAVNEMNLLQENEQYALFFESCRLLRNLQDISLEGFLLTPVQKICKYPLQLSELAKYTSEDHPDHAHVVAAQAAMKDVAMLINEQKRRIENMGKIGVWQKTIDGWKGPDILEHSSELIHQGELQKISKGHSQERVFFLFDHQLIYCRKDTIGGKLAYKGRFNLDVCQVHDLAEGQALHGSNPVRNGWRMNNTAKANKTYIIYAKSPQIKEEWMRAFDRERERVQDDKDRDFDVPLKMKMAAVSLSTSTTEARRRKKSMQKRHVAITESVDTVVKNKLETSGKRLTAPAGSLNQVTSPQMTKKQKGGRKKKLHSVSTSTRAVY